MIEIGRLCVKLAGRDAGKRCVVVDILDNRNVMIDGETRRRKCNISHLALLSQKLEISKGESHESVVRAFKKLKIDVAETKPKEKTERPRRHKKAVAKEETVTEKKKEGKEKPKKAFEEKANKTKSVGEEKVKTAKAADKKPAPKKSKPV